MAAPLPQDGLSQTDAQRLRAFLAPMFATLNNQGGGESVNVEMTVANVRKVRRILYPMPQDLAAVSGFNWSSATESERRALRAAAYPEPVVSQ